MIAALGLSLTAFADEGMWLLPLIEKMNGASLLEAGCKLTPDRIYSINHSSLKDAVVHFGGGCTGEIISDEGLLVTNHHCGYSSIQGLSTPEHNYLMDGYWAMTRDGELPVPGLTVTFMEAMTDVTARIGKDPEAEKALIAEAEAAYPGCNADVYAFYNDNVFYLIVYKTYRDVRFVGAPPASIGKFGGETDNWMWPRHTGDFSMFRVYAGLDNEPADYAPENVPLHPKGHLKISLKGVEEGDYAMIMGYPGRTQRFQTAAQLKQMIASNRIRIDARTVRQDIMWEAMCADPTVQLQYANKYAGSANGWKKWQGEELAFGKLDIIGREEAKEAAFAEWVGADRKRQGRYGGAVEKIAEAVAAQAPAQDAVTLLTETAYRIELVTAAGQFNRAYARAERDDPEASKEALREKAIEAVVPFYRDYVEALDRQEAVALLRFYRAKAAEKDYLPLEGWDFATMDIGAYVDDLFAGSIFTSEEKLRASLAGADAAHAIEADPAMRLFRSIMQVVTGLYPEAYGSREALQEGSKAFTAGLLEWEKGKPSYPDANSTMRLTYGHVLPYSPKDAVLYRHYSTLTGVMEKEDASNPEFIVPERLKELYAARDFGPYGTDGDVRVCFLTNNDITGGNSGSPVLDAEGSLIGLAFDGNWESMSSDVMFEPDLQRCICVDIRYVLFLVDKFGGASHLIDELDIVR